jgi:sialic acid synthase
MPSVHSAPTPGMVRVELAPGRFVGPEDPVYFIAEGGINHNGCLQTAKSLIVAAKAVGADAVKFQKRTVEAIFTKAALDKPYMSENAFASTYGEHKKVLEFDEDQWRELKAHADSVGITLCGSGWDEGAVDMLERVGVPFFKMASADLLNLPLLEHTARKGKPVIISTGMATMDDVDAAVRHLRKFTSQIVLMQCTSTYPSKPELIHLNVLKTYAKRFPDAVLGYSGHESGVVISQAAMCLGACVVEKHFTLDRTMRGSDHAASLELSGFRDLVLGRRKIELALGGFEKVLQPGEAEMKAKLAKSAVSLRRIPKGTVVTREMITFKSPGDAIPPNAVDKVLIGKTANVDIEGDATLDAAWFA